MVSVKRGKYRGRYRLYVQPLMKYWEQGLRAQQIQIKFQNASDLEQDRQLCPPPSLSAVYYMIGRIYGQAYTKPKKEKTLPNPALESLYSDDNEQESVNKVVQEMTINNFDRKRMLILIDISWQRHEDVLRLLKSVDPSVRECSGIVLL